MQFAHVMLLVNDMEKAKKLWCDTLGFIATNDKILPDGPAPENFFTKEDFDAIWGAENAKSRMVTVMHPETYATIELQQSIYPEAENIPRYERQYKHQGIREVAFYVTNIEQWYEKIKAAGYEMQTDFIWTTFMNTKSFLFLDDDGNQIQLCEIAQMPQE